MQDLRGHVSYSALQSRNMNPLRSFQGSGLTRLSVLSFLSGGGVHRGQAWADVGWLAIRVLYDRDDGCPDCGDNIEGKQVE